MEDDAFGSYGRYYDLLYRDKDYEAEAAYVANTLRIAEPNARSVLEFGSGTGRHGRLLASKGFTVCGVERSMSMLAVALRDDGSPASGPPTDRFSCSQGDIRTHHFERQFDAVVALFHVVSYQTANADLLATFANASRHLRPGGVFLFDVWHGPAVLSQGPCVRIKRAEDDTTRIIRIAEPELDLNRGMVIVRYTILAEAKDSRPPSRIAEEHRMRYLFPTEIAMLAHHTGFDVERSEEFLTGRPPSEDTWGVMYLLRKPA